VVVDHESLPDGMDTTWDIDVVAQIVREHITKFGSGFLFTFDDYGISGHANHIATHKGVARACRTLVAEGVPLSCFFLESTSLFYKFGGVAYFFLALLRKKLALRKSAFSSIVNYDLPRVFGALMKHRSQRRWYRMAFIIFSRFTYMNTFVTRKQ
jgi:N-acetylglucosaminylphosphatidylinositol deacetylase